MNKDRYYAQVEDCLLEDMDGELLLFNPNTATTLHLNGPSAVVWSLCTGDHSVGQMIDVLQEAFPEQAEQIEGDVFSVIRELRENKVIERVGLGNEFSNSEYS